MARPGGLDQTPAPPGSGDFYKYLISRIYLGSFGFATDLGRGFRPTRPPRSQHSTFKEFFPGNRRPTTAGARPWHAGLERFRSEPPGVGFC
jgi:hypothetical protein